jgi:hypothetical protein
MYSFDKKTKKIVDPMGSSLYVSETVEQLNRMYAAITQLHLSWRIISDGVSVMDGVFMGATAEPIGEEGITDGDSAGVVSEEPAGVQDSPVVL